MRCLWLVLLLSAPCFAQISPPSGSLGFEEAVRKIVDRNPNVGLQRASLDSVKARNLPAHLSLLPSLSVKASETRNNQNDPESQSRGIEADLGMNLFRFGADVSAMRAASSEEDAQERLVVDAVIRAEDEGVKAIVGVIQADLEVSVMQRILDMRGESLKISKERFARGLLAQEEVDKISVDYDNARADLRDKQIAAATAHAALTALLGPETVRIDWPWSGDWERETATLLKRGESELAQRPDWQAAEKSREAASLHQREAWGKIWPSLDVSLSYGIYSVRGRYLPDFDGPQWGGAITLTVPLFDKLSNYGAYKQQMAQKQTAELQLVKVQRQAKSEWESSRRSLEVALESARARDATLATSRRLYQVSLRRFQAGYADANQLAIDQQRLYNSELLDIQGWGTVHQDFSQLCHSLGYRLDQCLKRPEGQQR